MRANQRLAGPNGPGLFAAGKAFCWRASRPFPIVVLAAAVLQASSASAEDRGASTGAGEEPEAIILSPGDSRDERLGVAQRRDYRVQLGPGQAALLSLRQTGDAGLELHRATAQPPLQNDSGRQSYIRLTLIGNADGAWRISVAAAKKGESAAYSIGVSAAHAATAADRERAAAEQSLAQAEALRRAGDRQSVPQARRLYQDAIKRWQSAADPCGSRAAYVGLARLYQFQLSDYPAAQAAAQASLRQGCEGDWAEQAKAENTLAAAAVAQGDFLLAAGAGERALALYRRTGDVYRQGIALGNLSLYYRNLGQTQKALRAAQSALKIAQDGGDDQGVVFARGSIAAIYSARGELAAALDTFRETLQELRSKPSPTVEGMTWSMLGGLYRRLGDYPAAYAAVDKAQSICTALGSWNCLAAVATTRAEILFDERRLDEAASAFEQVIAIGLEHGVQSRRGDALRGLGRCRLIAGRWSEARSAFESSARLFRRLGAPAGEADAYLALGDLESEQGRLVAARNNFQKALDISGRIKDRSGMAIALASLARTAQATGNLNEAGDYIERALALVESGLSEIGDPGLRTRFFSSKRSYYELYIDVLTQLEPRHAERKPEAALIVAERARARSLQDLLIERGIAIGKNVDPDLLAEERETADHLQALAYRRAQLGEAGEQLQRQLDEASARLDEVRGRIRKADPRYAELLHPEALSLDEIKARLLDPDTVLLEYWLGEQRSHLWVVAPEGVEHHALPGRARIEALARSLRERILARPGTDVPMERLAEVEAANASAVRTQAGELGRLLLGPAAAALRQGAGAPRKLAIVADGELQLLPFGLLAAETEPLMAAHEIAYLPSIATLRWLRRAPAGAASAPRRLAVFADPVFRADDPRITGRAGVPTDEHAVVLRAAADLGLTELPRLRHSREEAQALARLDPSGAPWLALDFDASREAVLSARWPGFRIVHFATHALLDLRHPDLSGVVLSLYDAQGRPRDGYLRMNDIYRLDLPAELVVLSACESALGRDLASEGLYGLARAFFYAGTPRVIGSLWPTDDAASAEFMTRFYRALFAPGGRAAAALRVAQNAMAADPRWSAPYWWAGYVLQGDWR